MTKTKTKTIKIPVIVREDGAVFVWQQDTSTHDIGTPRIHGDPFHAGRQGQDQTRHTVWIVATVPIPDTIHVVGVAHVED